MKDRLPPQQEAKRLGGSTFKALDLADYAHPPTLFRAILTDEPYPVRALIVVGSNVVTTYPNTKKVIEALKRLDLLVVHDIFMTPTAQLADVVLPAAANLERDEPRLHLHIKGPHATFMDTVSQKLTAIGERKSDWEFMIELGRKLGGCRQHKRPFSVLRSHGTEADNPPGPAGSEGACGEHTGPMRRVSRGKLKLRKDEAGRL